MTIKTYYAYAPAFAAIFVAIGLLLGSTFFDSGPRTVSAQVAQPTPVVQQAAAGVRSVTVTGSGSVDAVPDLAIVTLGVRSQANTAREALTQNNTHMQSLVDALTTSGVDKKDIKTQTVQIQPQYEQQPQTSGQTEGTPKLTGYIALNTVDVTVRDLAKLGQLLDSAVTAGSNDVSNIRFDLSNPTQSQDQARQAAMQDAARKASQLAALGNATLGPVISIEESTAQPVPYMGLAAGPATQNAQSVPVSPGTQSIQVTVQVTWELNTK